MDKTDWVGVGRLLGAHGVRGELKVHAFTEDKEQLLDHSSWWLGPDGGPYREVGVVSGRANAKGLIVRLADVNDREMAQALSGTEIWMARSQLPEPEEDQFYWSDLEGCRMVTEAGEDVGEVLHLFETGANDVMVVDSSGEERLIPFISEVVLHVDTEAKRVVVRLMPGM
ncbi:MAG: 16S rRNA processing protein RimM [Magnetococcales bacterium]|nr:16S rRNA processing protein RimM [Magnetococcales bacterium]